LSTACVRSPYSLRTSACVRALMYTARLCVIVRGLCAGCASAALLSLGTQANAAAAWGAAQKDRRCS
jgi:hypothetical protein